MFLIKYSSLHRYNTHANQTLLVQQIEIYAFEPSTLKKILHFDYY